MIKAMIAGAALLLTTEAPCMLSKQFDKHPACAVAAKPTCEKVTALQACKQAAEQSHPASRMQGQHVA
jgi:hypothetical protein